MIYRVRFAFVWASLASVQRSFCNHASNLMPSSRYAKRFPLLNGGGVRAAFYNLTYVVIVGSYGCLHFGTEVLPCSLRAV